MYKMIILILFLLQNSINASNFFDAISNMELLIDTEEKLIDNLKLYVKTEEEILNVLEK